VQVGIHNLSPGMVTTELLMSGANTPQAKFFINCLGARAGFVCVCGWVVAAFA
jgi:chlorophyll(ide) b reductase